jgi:hypothetical protein
VLTCSFLLVGIVGKVMGHIFGFEIRFLDDGGEGNTMSLSEAVVGAPGNRELAGTPTYRLPHHPR